MYFFYVDESGNTGAVLDGDKEPVHWLVALGIRESDVMELEDAMSQLAGSYCFPESASPDFEFHGGHIFHGRGYFRELSVDQRVDLYGDLLDLLEEHSCKIAVRGIHKQRHAQRAASRGYSPDHPHKLGFMYLMEQIDEWLERQQDDEVENLEYGLVVADEQREVNRDLIERFPRWRNWGTDHGYRTREIEYLIDTIHTVPSHDSWMIQLTDCVAYIRNRYWKIRESKKEQFGRDWLFNPEKYPMSESEAAVQELWRDRCDPCVISARVWPQLVI